MLTSTHRTIMTGLFPLTFEPVLAAKPWGGRRLAKYGKVLPPGVEIGESWEIADLPEDATSSVDNSRSRVATGMQAGATLRDLIVVYGSDFIGSAELTPEGDLPLLVKLLDVREHLSVQVHPDEAYVMMNSEARLKTESWYVVDAQPGALLYLGFRPGVTRPDVAARMGTAGIVGLLNGIAAAPGDFHHLPAGLVHALGPGVVVAEVQTPSDTTFRIYDWDDRYKRPNRRMHTAKALEAIRFDTESLHSDRPSWPGARVLVNGSSYWIVEHRGPIGIVEIDRREELRVLMFLSGSAELNGDAMSPGQTVLLPAAVAPETGIVLGGSAVMLEIGLC